MSEFFKGLFSNIKNKLPSHESNSSEATAAELLKLYISGEQKVRKSFFLPESTNNRAYDIELDQFFIGRPSHVFLRLKSSVRYEYILLFIDEHDKTHAFSIRGSGAFNEKLTSSEGIELFDITNPVMRKMPTLKGKSSDMGYILSDFSDDPESRVAYERLMDHVGIHSNNLEVMWSGNGEKAKVDEKARVPLWQKVFTGV